MPINLPTEANIPPNDIGAYTILISGQKKIGKTSFAAEFPGVFVLQFEPGNSRALPVKQIDIPSWGICLEVIEQLEKYPNYAKTLVIDDVPSMYFLAQEYCCSKLRITYPGDLAMGKGWAIQNTEFTKAITRIQNLPCGKIYTAHSQVMQADTRTGRVVSTLETAMGRGCDRVMDAKVQISGLITFNKNKERVLIIQGDDYIVKAGQGIPNRFLDEKGQQLKEIPLGKTAKEGYQNFIKAFNNQLRIGPEVKPQASDKSNNSETTNLPKKFTVRK